VALPAAMTPKANKIIGSSKICTRFIGFICFIGFIRFIGFIGFIGLSALSPLPLVRKRMVAS